MCVRVRGSIDRRVPVHTVGENKNDNDEHVDQHTSDSKRRRREWHAKCGGGGGDGHENSSNNKKNNNTEREKSRAHKRMIYVELIQLVFVIEKKKN